jgi:phosphohistidine phosphatase
VTGRPPRELLVLRHAKSAWPEGVDDHDRPLNGRGERAAGRMGRFLAAHGLRPDGAVASPARRAVDTARLVLEAAGADLTAHLDERLYGNDARAAIDDTWPRGERLLVVGHEPEMVELVARCTGARIRLPTAGLAWVQLTEEELQRGVLHLLVTPKMLDDAG